MVLLFKSTLRKKHKPINSNVFKHIKNLLALILHFLEEQQVQLYGPVPCFTGQSGEIGLPPWIRAGIADLAIVPVTENHLKKWSIP